MTLTKRGRTMVALAVIAAFIGAIVLGVYLWLRSIGVYGSSDPGREVAVTIPEGASAEEVGRILVDAGVISSTLGWRIYLSRHGGSENIQAGDYMIRTGLIPADALAELLEEGPAGPDVWRVTFREGLWLTEMAEHLEEVTDLSGDRFLRLTSEARLGSSLLPEGGETLEGLLFPSTYEFLKTVTEREVVEELVEQMEKEVEALDLSSARRANLTEYDIVVIASMIEAETRVDSERPMVARVIYNRLRQGIPLGIDATFLYALGERKDTLTASELAIDSPYNLRKNPGLPPTPIGAPGGASLEAAADPAQGDWLYYVLADCEGNHAFSSTNAEFIRDKRVYQSLDC